MLLNNLVKEHMKTLGMVVQDLSFFFFFFNNAIKNEHCLLYHIHSAMVSAMQNDV